MYDGGLCVVARACRIYCILVSIDIRWQNGMYEPDTIKKYYSGWLSKGTRISFTSDVEEFSVRHKTSFPGTRTQLLKRQTYTDTHSHTHIERPTLSLHVDRFYIDEIRAFIGVLRWTQLLLFSSRCCFSIVYIFISFVSCLLFSNLRHAVCVDPFSLHHLWTKWMRQNCQNDVQCTCTYKAQVHDVRHKEKLKKENENEKRKQYQHRASLTKWF